MQRKDEKSLHLSKQLGVIIRRLREEKTDLSLTQLSYSYDIDNGNLSRIENGITNCKFITLWKIAEAIGMKPSELVSVLETELGADFHLIDE